MQPPDSRQGRWVSFDQARMILRMSEGTLRRAIRTGTVEAAQFPRNPENPADKRSVYRVMITDPPAADAASEAPAAKEPATEPPAVITGLLELLAADRATIATLYAEQASLRERVGRAEERATAAEAELARLRARAERSWWKWW